MTNTHEDPDFPRSFAIRKMIEAERRRQIDVEGWTEAHDDEHDDGELFKAAIFYFAHAIGHPLTFGSNGAPIGWPWDAAWWKPKGYTSDLIRAGALCLAEQQRLERLGSDTAHVARKIDQVTNALRRNPLLTLAFSPSKKRESENA